MEAESRPGRTKWSPSIDTTPLCVLASMPMETRSARAASNTA